MKDRTRLTNSIKLERLIPRSKVAFYLSCCNRSVKRLEQKGLLTAHILNSRTTSYPEHEVLKLIADARTAAAKKV